MANQNIPATVFFIAPQSILYFLLSELSRRFVAVFIENFQREEVLRQHCFWFWESGAGVASFVDLLPKLQATSVVEKRGVPHKLAL